jgi:hypothetical protein
LTICVFCSNEMALKVSFDAHGTEYGREYEKLNSKKYKKR